MSHGDGWGRLRRGGKAESNCLPWGEESIFCMCRDMEHPTSPLPHPAPLPCAPSRPLSLAAEWEELSERLAAACKAPRRGSCCDTLASGESKSWGRVGGWELRPQLTELFISKMTSQLVDIQELLSGVDSKMSRREFEKLGGRHPQTEKV